MANESVLYQRHEGIVTLTLNRPDTLNAMNEAMMGEFERILIELEADTAARVVILTGAGRAFSSGGDQKRGGEVVPPSFFAGDPGGALIERLSRCILRMQRLPKPIIGSINGVAAGAGMNIALATDLRLASETARFGEVFASVGLVPDGGGTYFLPRLVGTAKAMELILLAVNINLVSFSAFLGDIVGQIYALIVLTVAAAEAAIGLAILVVFYRNRGSIAVEDINAMKG